MNFTNPKFRLLLVTAVSDCMLREETWTEQGFQKIVGDPLELP